ncbi:MAG TPA: PHP domain-containing protein [Candidatus Binatia bacterium]|nr:PHP domain-containing protein [Candidatus Binatia bacterium]
MPDHSTRMPERSENGSAPSRLRLGPGLSAAETHSHTIASDGMVTAVELVRAAASIGLSVICVTDHDTLQPLDEATEIGAALGIDVVAGEEVTCRFPPGIHVVGLFIRRAIRMHLSVEGTVDAIHDAGGLAVIAHPFLPTWFASITERRLARLLETRRVDGIEIRHTAPVLPGTWRRLDDFYTRHRDGLGAAMAAGDSHFGVHDLGRRVTVFPGSGATDLRRAIEARTTSPLAGLSPVGPPLSMRLGQQRRSLLELNLKRWQGKVGGRREL